MDREGTALDDEPFTYGQAGGFGAMIALTDDQAVTHRASVRVRVFGAGELNTLVQAKWGALKDALRAGNVSAALNHVAIRKRAAFEGYFNNLTVPLSSIDQVLTDLTFKEHRGANVEFEMIREQGGERRGYVVLFVLDEDGIWRLKAL